VLEIAAPRFTGLLRINAALECPTCSNETLHEVRYVAGLLNEIRCVRCGQHWQMARHAVEEAYLRQLVTRVASSASVSRRDAIRLRLPSACPGGW